MSFVMATRVIGTRKFYLLSDHSTVEVTWNGGELLPPYDSTSSWAAVERYFRMKVDRCQARLGKALSDDSLDSIAPNASPQLPPASANRKTHRTLRPRSLLLSAKRATSSLATLKAGSRA